MQQIDKWVPTKFKKDAKGRFEGTHMHQAIGPVYERAIKTFAKGDLIDLGCGNVPLYAFYKEQANSITCVDWASSGGKDKPKIHLDVSHDLNEPLPFDKEQFDTVICTDVLEHIQYPHKLFAEMTRVLRPQGRLILTVPFYYWLHERPYDFHRYTEYALKGFCEDNHMEVLELHQYGGAPEILFDVFYKSTRLTGMRLFRMLDKPLMRFGKFMLRTKPVKKFSQSTRSFFPLGYCLIAEKS